MEAFWQDLAKALKPVLERKIEWTRVEPLSGGCIASASKAETSCEAYFVKTREANAEKDFEHEAYALRAIAKTDTLRVPAPIWSGVIGDRACLVLEYLSFGPSRGQTQTDLGTGLARLHQKSGDIFGWPHDNVIGASPQLNSPCEDWISFFRERRLRPQLEWARQKGLQFSSSERLLDNLDFFFGDYQPAKSLLHGDLWGGNVQSLVDGTPVLFDPASYYGDRETDLAFTYLFGGFSPEFYRAYSSVWPLDSGFDLRRPLYNLYHILNHFNLFGGGYGSEAKDLLQQLTTQCTQN